MKLYRTPGGKWSGTQADHRQDMAAEGLRGIHEMQVPTDKPSLIDWLNKEGRSRQLARENAEPAAPATIAEPGYAGSSIALEVAWEALPLALKLHFAALAVEDARDIIKKN